MSQYYYQGIQGTSHKHSSSQDSTNASTSLTGVNSTNTDGDTFQFSGAVPPPPAAAYTSNGSDTSTGSQSGNALDASQMFAKLDTDDDGSLTEAEFIAGRPDDVSEEMAKNLYKNFNSDSADALTESEYETAMANAPAPPQISGRASGGAASAEDFFSKLDTDGDGVVSQSEFLAAKPDDVSDEMAQQLYKSLDSNSDDSLTAQEYAAASMAAPPPPPPPQSSNGSASSGSAATAISDLLSQWDTDGDGVVSEAEFLAARPDDVTEEMAQQLYNSLDTNGDGTVSASEYAAAAQQSVQQASSTGITGNITGKS